MKLKKLLVSTLVGTMVLGSVATASAAGLTDTAGKKYDAAATRLNALEILKGYEDGSFKGDRTITRAEFAAVAVRALGQADAATSAKGNTKFSDVTGDHWASGYINVAVEQGLLKGYPDGTFKPENNVTYAESLAILVRALGYEPTIRGSWPTNYLIKAADLGLSKDVSFDASKPATRGDVAIFTDTSLDVDLLVQKGYGDLTTFEVVKGDTLLTTKLNVTKVVDAKISTGTPRLSAGNLKPNFVTYTYKDANGAYGPTATKEVISTINPDEYAGVTVDVLINKDDKVVGLKTKTEASNIVTGTIDRVDAGKIYLKDNSTAYELAAGANAKTIRLVHGSSVVSHDNAPTDATLDFAANQPDARALKGSKVKMVLGTDSKVVFIEGFKDDDSVIVKAVDANLQTVTYDDKNTNTNGVIALKDTDYVIEKDGKRVDLNAIKAGDALRVISLPNGNSYRYLIVGGKTVSGKLESIESSGVGAYASNVLTIGGKGYKLAGGAFASGTTGATYSTDNDATSQSVGSITNLNNLIGQDVTVTLNTLGQIRHIKSGAGSNSFTAMVLVPPQADGSFGTYKVKVFKFDGTIATYDFVDKDAYDAAAALTLTAGTFVRVSLNSDGKLSKTGLAAESDVTYNTSGAIVTGANKDYSTITIDPDGAGTAAAVTYRVASTSVFIDRNSEVTGFDPKVVANSDVIGTNFGAAPGIGSQAVDFKVKDGVVVFAVFTANGVALTSSTDLAVIVATGVNANGKTVKLNVKGTETTYEDVSGTNYSVGTVVTYTATGSKVNTLTQAVYVNEGRVVQIDTTNNQVKIDTDGDLQTIGDQVWVLLTSDTAFYDTDPGLSAPKSIALNQLANGYTIRTYNTTKNGVTYVGAVVVTKH